MKRTGKRPTNRPRRNYWLLLLAFCGPALDAQNAQEIVRRSVEKDQFSSQHARDYAWVQRVETHLNSGKDKDTVRTSESMFLYGRRFNRLIARNDQPLTPEEQKREQERLDKRIAEHQHESAAREAQREKNRERQRAFALEIPDIYDFKIEGQEVVDGYDAWVISAAPKPGYKPRDKDARPLQKFRGKLWIDKSEYQWVRVEAEVIEPLTWGLFLVKLNPGSHIKLEQTRVNGEIWLPKHQTIRMAARLVFKHFDMEQDITYRDYRKFVADSKIVGTGEAK